MNRGERLDYILWALVVALWFALATAPLWAAYTRG